MKQKSIPVETRKKGSDRVVDLLSYKNHYVLLEKLHTILGNHISKLVCRGCLSSYTNQNILMKHKQRCEL